MRARPALGACLVLLGGCGRIGFDLFGLGDDEPPRDGPVPDMVDMSTYPDAPVLPPFSGIGPVGGLDSPTEDDDPTLPEGQLEIFFSSLRVGITNCDVFTSTRATLADPWSTPTLVPGLDTGEDEITPEISADGLTLYFSRGPVQAGPHDIYVTTRPAVGAAWGTAVRVDELSTAGNDFAAAPDASHLALVVTIDNRLHLTMRATTAEVWSVPVPILSGVGDQTQAWLGETELYFTIVNQIWRAVRHGPTTFGPEHQVTELVGDSTDPWLSVDGHTLFFTRDDVIYSASR